MATQILTQARLKELLHYDPDTGVMTWQRTKKRAGTQHRLGYRNVMVAGRTYAEHRLAWCWVYGRWPSHDLDHINRVRNDNRLCNLRETTRAENCQNQPVRKSNQSGVTGVYYHKVSGKWAASINVAKKQVHLGVFDTVDAAVAARRVAETQHYKFKVA